MTIGFTLEEIPVENKTQLFLFDTETNVFSALPYINLILISAQEMTVRTLVIKSAQ